LSEELQSSIGDALANTKDPIVLLNKVDLVADMKRGDKVNILVAHKQIKATFVQLRD
jgi:hypothetical protein